MQELDKLEQEIHELSTSKGFWTLVHGEDQVNQLLAKMMLVDTEVSELADAYVKERWDEVELEMADIIIRLLDLHAGMKKYGIIDGSLFSVVLEKHEFNKTRNRKHGRLM